MDTTLGRIPMFRGTGGTHTINHRLPGELLERLKLVQLQMGAQDRCGPAGQSEALNAVIAVGLDALGFFGRRVGRIMATDYYPQIREVHDDPNREFDVLPNTELTAGTLVFLVKYVIGGAVRVRTALGQTFHLGEHQIRWSSSSPTP